MSQSAMQALSPLTSVYLLEGLDCADCAAKLEKKVASLPGVTKASINFGAGKLVVEHTAPPSTIVHVIEQSGYYIITDQKKGSTTSLFSDRKTKATLLSGILLAAAMFFDTFNFSLPFPVSTLLYAAAMITGGYYIAKSGFSGLRSLTFDTNFLMMVAAVGAITIGEWSEGATVVFLFSLGNTLQRYTMDKTRQSIRTLMEIAPLDAMVLRDGKEEKQSVEIIMPGDIIRIRPGERIPLDATVISGLSAVNQATVTGESIPVEKHPGDTLFAGTLNENGVLEAVVSKPYKDSTLARIIHLVEEAQASKAPLQQFVDVFAKYYTPAVIFGAIFLTIIPWVFFNQPFTIWFYRSLILLVISCPCALVISTPVSIVSAIGHASRQGILIKGGSHLEQMSAIQAIAFDKTGTLTNGRPEVTDIIPFGNKTPETVLSIAASIEQWTQHPLAQAIVQKNAGFPLHPVTNTQIIPGKGIKGEMDGQMIYAGNLRYFTEMNLPAENAQEQLTSLERQGKTAILIGTTLELWGIIALADTLRSDSGDAIFRLRQEGIKTMVMLTGDNQFAGASIASRLHLDHAYSQLLPQDKVAVIQELQQKFGSTAMVGDGVNDAPALASASIGIAMGGAGSDTAMETADITLMNDDLSKIPYLLRLSRKTLHIIKENIYFSLIVKVIFVVITFLGSANLWMAVVADTGAALLVIANGMRLMKNLPTNN